MYVFPVIKKFHCIFCIEIQCSFGTVALLPYWISHVFVRESDHPGLPSQSNAANKVSPTRTIKSVQPGQSSQSNAANQVSPTRPIKSVQPGQSSQSNPDNQPGSRAGRQNPSQIPSKDRGQEDE